MSRPASLPGLRVVSLAALVLAAPACRRAPVVDPAYRAEIEAARAERLRRLTAEGGWLAVAGLHWLAPGENAFGSAPDGAIPLEAPGLPPRAGAFGLSPGGDVSLAVEPGAAVTVNGAPPPARPLATDRSGTPDVVEVGRLRLTVLVRGDRRAVRVRDPESPRRTGFPGLAYYPLDPRLRVEGTFLRSAAPREVEVPSAQGPAQRMLVPGVVRFMLDGRELALEPFVDGPQDRTFFFVFRDATAGRGTYGAGRFLYSSAPPEGSARVVLDFNRALNPPCAFTPYATCPLPLPQNVLPVAVEAGEKGPAGHP